MELINYLNEYFYNKNQLLEISKVTAQDLLNYQYQGVMPRCSYKLKLNLDSDSFLGSYHSEEETEYYAKGYSSWLVIIQSLQTREQIYSVFENRYKVALDHLKSKGHKTDNPKINSDLDKHIKVEWQHFLDGTYGLCTKSGLPEDIAAKEFAIIEINHLIEQTDLNEDQLITLTNAVNLLDESSALFAPHERLTSSRHRLVNEVRRNYRLQ